MNFPTAESVVAVCWKNMLREGNIQSKCIRERTKEGDRGKKR